MPKDHNKYVNHISAPYALMVNTNMAQMYGSGGAPNSL